MAARALRHGTASVRGFLAHLMIAFLLRRDNTVLRWGADMNKLGAVVFALGLAIVTPEANAQRISNCLLGQNYYGTFEIENTCPYWVAGEFRFNNGDVVTYVFENTDARTGRFSYEPFSFLRHPPYQRPTANPDKNKVQFRLRASGNYIGEVKSKAATYIDVGMLVTTPGGTVIGRTHLLVSPYKWRRIYSSPDRFTAEPEFSRAEPR
jgi:hypothetical protein